MDTSNSGRQVRAWTAVGAMTSGAIFDRFDQNIIDSPPFSTEELDALESNFEKVCDDNGHIDRAAFSSFVASRGDLTPALREAIGILFDSLCYLSTAPLQTPSPSPDFLTRKALKRALVWSFPQKASSVMTNTSGYRERSPADHRRLIFQSLATLHQGRCPPVDSDLARALAADNARDFPPGYRGGPVEDEDVNYDRDGDEMYHDVLDFLASTQPYVPPTYAEPHRNSFRSLARHFHEGAPSLYDLAIPVPRLQAFLALLLATNLPSRVVDHMEDADLELDSVAQSIAACFDRLLEISVSVPSSERSSKLSDGIPWPMFNFAISKLLPDLLDSLCSLLSLVFFDEPRRIYANTGCTKPGLVLTLPRMVQLETFLYNSISMLDIRRLEKCRSSNGLVEAINNIKEYALLVVSGHTATNEAYVYGIFIARPPIDGPCIQNGGSDLDETALLFQLSPTHDVFRGTIGTPAWHLNEDGLIFGSKDHGVALALDASLTKARFTHMIPNAGAGGRDVYHPTVHRGDFETLLSIDAIELWGKLV